ncbi:hypothetical protein K1T35_48300 (plasmid) [Pseudonocardia sp. DSM 110487]|uniref:hypothetical protein n=1 Tax=Pseudonocardia sp. DSM 110487 TaxID=2865833 RepID=UPI001C6A2871|nr:hypothetical protein [Pseudonocardia sp. DSM 110487]QYN41151.1 hypothetical protein K1T35_48300 [Pseudonocardia sp. DSM 110487]
MIADLVSVLLLGGVLGFIAGFPCGWFGNRLHVGLVEPKDLVSRKVARIVGRIVGSTLRRVRRNRPVASAAVDQPELVGARRHGARGSVKQISGSGTDGV